MYLSPVTTADVPPAVMTVMSTTPALPDGGVTVIEPAASVRMVAGVVPNLTEVAPSRCVPVIVTVGPPVSGPAAGEMPETTGSAVYVYLSPAPVVDVPWLVVTVTSTTPALPDGGVTVMDVAVFAVMVPAVLPNLTEVALARFDPVIVTAEPPVSGPAVGEMLETTGRTL